MADVFARFGVPYLTNEARGGWISTHCPHCRGSADYHLGYSVQYKTFTCWRCGKHDAVETLALLCRLGRGEALDLWQRVRGAEGTEARLRRDRAVQDKIITLGRYLRPSDVGPMRVNHRRYLERRGFDPDAIEREWGVAGTGPVSMLDDGAGKTIDYRHRLLIPILWDGVEVSFQTRDVSGKADLKYLACPPRREVRSHKQILYGRQDRWGRTGILVEGVTDVWRLGPAACATFGIGYVAEQVRELARTFDRVAIVFDPEPQAQAKARELAATLRVVMRQEPVVVEIDAEDPGSMRQDDADHLVRQFA